MNPDPAAPERKAHRVLFCEEDPSLRELRSLLLSLSGFEVLVASDARGAVYDALRARPDCVVVSLPLSLPRVGGEGQEFLEGLRALLLEHDRRPVVIALSAHGWVPDPELVRALDPDLWLPLCVSPDELVAAVRRSLAH